MPGRDGTGPRGHGAATGRGAGRCRRNADARPCSNGRSEGPGSPVAAGMTGMILGALFRGALALWRSRGDRPRLRDAAPPIDVDARTVDDTARPRRLPDTREKRP